MEIVGIDFGTTNVRISTWDPDAPDAGLPQPRMIGRGGTATMPVVVALRRQPGGSVSIAAVGEEAEELEGTQNTEVIHNIKRWALSNDPYVKWRLEVSNIEWESWWNPELSCVEVGGQQFQAKELITAILREAVNRANLPDEFEWRAGCPVHAGYEYRLMLKEVLTEIAGKGSVNWVVDEPVLFLAAAQRNIDPDSPFKLRGSYMVYDLGGGSFDCTLVEVRDDGEMIVYGADGHPLLGGSNIDRGLAAKFEAPVNLLRLAKEGASPDNNQVSISGNLSLTWGDVETELKDGRFIQRSLMAMRDAYISAKSVVWRRDDRSNDSGDMVLQQDENTGELHFTWQLDYEDMKQDMDGVILFGGPTRSPFFAENLRQWFGDDKVILATDLIGGVDAPEITGVSMGACYYPSGQHFHEVPSRLPYRVTLENLQTGSEEGTVQYKPHQHFVETFQPVEQFASRWLQQDIDNPQEYELTITDPDGVVLERQAVDGYLESDGRHPATSLRLVIDRLGPVYVEKRSEGIGLPWTRMEAVVDNPPWQTEEQKEMLDALRERERQREDARRLEAQGNIDRAAYLEVN